MSPVIGNHADVLAILNAPEQWSNRVSTHLNVPNGMDAPEHTLYRAIIEPFFDHTTMAQFEGVVRSIVRKIFAELPEHYDVMSDLAYPFALRVQCAFMGWPETLKNALLKWIKQQREASAAQDREVLTQLAAQFKQLMIGQFEQARRTANKAPHNITQRL